MNSTSTKKLSFVLGTAGELIKVFPVLQQATEAGFDWNVLSTGQSGVNFLSQWRDFKLEDSRLHFALESDRDLKSSQQALKWFVKAWRLNRFPFSLSERSWLIVHGDTLSTLVGARWARRYKVKLAHIEAGLRSKSLWSPFPEEINRRCVSRWAHLHLTPDRAGVENLKQVSGEVVCTEGNSMKDALGKALEKPMASLQASDFPKKDFVLANIHRFENLNSRRRWDFIKKCLFQAAREQEVYLVLHPSTYEKIKSENSEEEFKSKGVQLLPRKMFSEFSHLLNDCRYLITDGGSNQEECFYLGKPCLILRDFTERMEGLGENAVLSEFDSHRIEAFLKDPEFYLRPQQNFDYKTSNIILAALRGES